MSRKTVTTPEAPGAWGGVVAETDPATLEAAARMHLDATRARLADLADRTPQREQQLAILSAQQQAAQEYVERTAAAVETFPAALATARARLLIAQSQSARSAMQREIDALLERQQEAVQEHQAATDDAQRIASEVAESRERLATEAEQEQAERAELDLLIPALMAEIQQAHEAAGQIVLERLQAEHAELDAARRAAQATLDTSTAALEGFTERVRAELEPHPALLAQANGHSSLLPRQASRPERAIAAYLQLIDILAEGPFQVHELSVGGMALGRAVSIEPTTAFAWALQGYGGGSDFWAARRRLAEQYLENYYQGNGAH